MSIKSASVLTKTFIIVCIFGSASLQAGIASNDNAQQACEEAAQKLEQASAKEGSNLINATMMSKLCKTSSRSLAYWECIKKMLDDGEKVLHTLSKCNEVGS